VPVIGTVPEISVPLPGEEMIVSRPLTWTGADESLSVWTNLSSGHAVTRAESPALL
jgi:hypothetical protein